jgi:hypothetical protein
MKRVSVTFEILAACLLAATLLIAGCSSDKAKMSEGDVKAMRSSYESLSIGMSKDEALGTFKKGNKVKMSSSSIAGKAIEEWKVEGYHDDDWNKTRDMFITFLYFADGRLVDVSDRRLSIRENPELVQSWGGGGADATAEDSDE